MRFHRAEFVPPKHAVRFAGVVTTPVVALTTGAVHDPERAGSRRTPSSGVPTIPSNPRNLNEKSPVSSAVVGNVLNPTAARRWIVFHSSPQKKKNLSFPDVKEGPPPSPK